MIQNAELLIIKAIGTYIYHQAFKGKFELDYTEKL
jgi:hypothetical protein